jgi:hypothetical protein
MAVLYDLDSMSIKFPQVQVKNSNRKPSWIVVIPPAKCVYAIQIGGEAEVRLL